MSDVEKVLVILSVIHSVLIMGLAHAVIYLSRRGSDD